MQSRKSKVNLKVNINGRKKKASCAYCKKKIKVDWIDYRYDHTECGDCSAKGREAYVCNECAEEEDYTCPVCRGKGNSFPPHEMWTKHPNHWSDCVNEEEENEEREPIESTRGKRESRRRRRVILSPTS